MPVRHGSGTAHATSHTGFGGTAGALLHDAAITKTNSDTPRTMRFSTSRKVIWVYGWEDMHRSLVLVALVTFSCGREAPKVAGESVDRQSGEAVEDGGSVNGTPRPDQPTELVITNLAPGEFELSTSTGAAVATKTRVERKDTSGSWTPLEQLDLGNGYRLVASCAVASPPACTTISAGAALHPVPWQGLSCSSQCNRDCDKNVWLGAGTFRLVVSPCAGDDKSTETAGPAFELPSHDVMGLAFDRYKLSVEVTEVTATRLEPPDASWSATAPSRPNAVAGFAVRAGSEHAFDTAAVASLVALLRNPNGFDDKTATRCAMARVVGLRLTRNLATTGKTPRSETVELAIDFNCHKLFAVRGGTDGRPRTVLATQFDPSSAAFAAIVKKAFADDKELATIR